MIADVISYWNMTSFMAIDGVTSFLRLKDVTNSRKRMRRLLCNIIEIDQLKCVICCVLGNCDRIISDALENLNQEQINKTKESNFSN